MLEMVIAHQTPSSPSAVPERSRAIGIRAAVNKMLTTAGGMVLEKPEKALRRYIQEQKKQDQYQRI